MNTGDWLTFDSSRLQRIVEALRKRRKTIRYKTRALVFDRELDEQDGKPYERLNIDARRQELRPTQIRLSLWEDSTLWLGIHKPAKRGWAFTLEFHGTFESLSPEDVVRKFEETISMTFDGLRPQEAEENLRVLWSEATPQ